MGFYPAQIRSRSRAHYPLGPTRNAHAVRLRPRPIGRSPQRPKATRPPLRLFLVLFLFLVLLRPNVPGSPALGRLPWSPAPTPPPLPRSGASRTNIPAADGGARPATIPLRSSVPPPVAPVPPSRGRNALRPWPRGLAARPLRPRCAVGASGVAATIPGPAAPSLPCGSTPALRSMAAVRSPPTARRPAPNITLPKPIPAGETVPSGAASAEPAASPAVTDSPGNANGGPLTPAAPQAALRRFAWPCLMRRGALMRRNAAEDCQRLVRPLTRQATR